ncbi:MAG: PEP-CTERM sorting domain-containing protein [Gammaproteobacteria bacterium]|nr:PEP-CTERM sorting domain-containing protein [Gammaproteobacteria bacterium]
MKKLVLAVALAVVPTFSFAGPVDLSGWIENGFQGNNGSGTWTVQGLLNDTVLQSINGDPTVFFDSGANDQNKALKGTIKVETSSDDDYIGFVLGYQNGELNSGAADFWLVDWKQGTQTYNGGTGKRGISLSHVTGGTSSAPWNDYWAHTGVVSEKIRGTNLGDTGWADNTSYTFDIEFTSTLIKVIVDGITELEWTNVNNGGLFSDGAFGFYNMSQGTVRYAGITEETAPSAVPIPAALPLFGTGLAFMGFFGWRRKRKATSAA